MKKLFIYFGISCAMWVSFHLGTVWATNDIYRSIDAISAEVDVLDLTVPHKAKDSRIMDKYR